MATRKALSVVSGLVTEVANTDVVMGQPIGGTWYQSYGQVAVGVGQMAIPFYCPCAMRITYLQYWYTTAGSGGTPAVELRKNGTAGGNTVSGSSGTPAASSPTALTGLTLDFAVDDAIYIYSTAINTTAAIGLAVRWKGYILG